MPTKPCPLCSCEASINPQGHDEGHDIRCKVCGNNEISIDDLGIFNSYDERSKSSIVYQLSQHKRQEKRTVNKDLIEQLKDNRLPNYAEQINNLIRIIGDYSEYPGADVGFSEREIAIRIGCMSGTSIQRNINYIHEEVYRRELLRSTPQKDSTMSQFSYELSAKGWELYESLKRSDKDSTRIFLARQYNEPTLDTFYKEIKAKVEEKTGLELFILDNVLKAGLIDNQLRDEIRKSKIVLADLTKRNPGAYWEAGYAEGLGISVIYLCEESEFEEQKTHFDVNHHTTIIWNPNDPMRAGDKLISTIKLTLEGLINP